MDEPTETSPTITPEKTGVASAVRVSPASFASGRYQVGRLLGKGGQKEVYLARDIRLTRAVAISVLKTNQLDENSVDRLWNEARSLAQLGDHPNIVTIFDVGDERGEPYVVSQYVEGGSVATLIRDANGSPLPLDEIVRIATEVCRALAYSHSRGIVHRDVKPANVWLTTEGAVKLGDFGLAFNLQLSSGSITSKSVLGTASYIPPELALGRQANPRSDLYSLGVMLYEMATGRLPFTGDLVSVISQHIQVAPVAPSWHNPKLPQALDNLILNMMAKLPEDRPQNADDVGKALLAITPSRGAAEGVMPRDRRSLARLAGGVFVGREREMKELRSGLDEAISGRGRLFFVTGEPGGGKTRTAEQLATYARLRGAEVLFGSCYEDEGAPAFWPWMQIIRSYAGERDSVVLRATMGSGAADIAQMDSDVRQKLPDLPSPPVLEPKQARFRLFDSITTFLSKAGENQPLVLILDDLHWADQPSLLLLQFIARELRHSRVLIVGTYRDIPLQNDHPLSACLAELSRQGIMDRIVLSGLSRQEAARFIQLTTGTEASEELVTAVHRQTEGNPFFLSEVLKLLVADDSLSLSEGKPSLEIRIPQSVREVVGNRLDRLSEECNRILAIASVVGREFSLQVLEPLSKLSSDSLLEALEEATAARVITETPHQPGTFSFSHALIRETLYDRLSGTRRVLLHRRIGEELELWYGANPEPHLPELAHHFFKGAQVGDVGKAIDYAVRAAKRATILLAYEEAVSQYERALQALGLQTTINEEHQCELWLDLGDALNRAGDSAKARETFQRAANCAKSRRKWQQLARAALGIGSSGVLGMLYGTVDLFHVGALGEALAGLDQKDSPLRVRLLAQMSLARYYANEQRLVLSHDAVEMSRRIDDKAARLDALYSRCVSLEGFDKSQERLALASELVDVAEQAGDREMALRGHYRRLRELIELGDITAVYTEAAIYIQRAQELKQPLYLWLAPYCKANLALMEGRFEDAEQLTQESLAIGKRAHEEMAVLFVNVNASVMRKIQRRYDELVLRNKELVKRYPTIPAWRASLAEIYAKLNRWEEARAEMELLAQNDFADIVRDGAWTASLSNLANVCALLHDVRHAQILYDLLLSFAERNVVLGNSAVFYGPVSHYLGLLAAAMSQWDAADRHFEHSIEMNRKMGARPFEVHSQIEYGAALMARSAAGRRRGIDLLNRGIAGAEEMRMGKVVEHARGILNG